ncbi:outer membrane transport energization protein ExbB [Albidovulum inexpectatum]|uniref:Outer membrane transport energization protein ExbB n=1 Tax=Albidovulum inexpectatum TaxID=196587 RepID=A0A2S5JH61_9RHOB|nr:MotA/TolQ/ExbB proton channel family protein [Albidovulum inexpectatum]PPB80844.1 outer membrane transport energization protein ExbB [Albidovulum inexpectatum]
MIGTVIEGVRRIADLGGPVVLLLVALSVLSASVAIYKFWQHAAAGVGRHRELMRAVGAWDSGDRAGARAHLERSRSYLAPVVAMAMDAAARGNADAARLEAEAEAHFARLERGLRLLDFVAQLAPLLGLFGTVLGMISAFQALQQSGTQVDPSVLAGGIWVALLTTAVGLGVAMPISLALNWFDARMDAERVTAMRALHTVLAPLGRIAADDAAEPSGAVSRRAHA